MAKRKRLRFKLLIILATRVLADDERAEQYTSKVLGMSDEEIYTAFGHPKQPLYSTPSRQSKIDHFVVLFMENRAAAHMFGCMDLPGFDSVINHTLPDGQGGNFRIQCGTADYACESGPSYSTFDPKFGNDDSANPNFYPYSPQNDTNSYLHGAGANATSVRMFSEKQIPIKAAIAHEFGVFNKLYTAVPSASSPNHLFAQSGTSCGMQANALYDDCGGENSSFPQKTIYDSLREHNVSFGFFINSTCGIDGAPKCRGENPITDDSPSAINTPDVGMAGVARYVDTFFSQQRFYEWAAAGDLPAFSWINPPLQACDHPCYDVAKGERMLKDVYEALRASPKWNKTLLFVAYDDAGGFYDPVVPPFEGVPSDESDCNLPFDQRSSACGEPFDFRRLGLRATAMLIGAMVPKAAIFQEPKHGPYNTSQFELTSIAATVKNLFNLTSFLTKRDAWAGNFEELLLDEPRTDAPLHLPDAPDPQDPWEPPPTTSSTRPIGHCSSFHGQPTETDCKRTHAKANLKQRRQIRLFSSLTGLQVPGNYDDFSFHEADSLLTSLWESWVQMSRRHE